MDAPTLDELQERLGRLRAECDLLAERCNRADPAVSRQFSRVIGSYWSGGDYAGRPGNAPDVVAAGDYAEDTLGAHRMALDYQTARRDWLRERARELEKTAQRRLAGYEAASRGVARFLGDGRYSLDRLLAATRDDPECSRRSAANASGPGRRDEPRS